MRPIEFRSARRALPSGVTRMMRRGRTTDASSAIHEPHPRCPTGALEINYADIKTDSHHPQGAQRASCAKAMIQPV
ncbi:hypothetical protein RHIZ404_230576 [Rhizobium sp. EC-SD404]|nr:hypothetical protein RHIZ404_230576 [Rhizobium sp. EC-SD404]